MGVAVLAQRVEFAFQVAAGDVIKEQCGRGAAAIEIAPVERFLDRRLAHAEIVEGGIEVVLVEGGETEDFGDRMIFGPADGGQARALVGDAGQDEEEGEFGEAGFAESGSEAEGIGDLLEGEQKAEDEAEGGVGGGEVIEVAAEGALEGLDVGGGPMGEIGEGAGMDLAILAEALAEEDGGWGGAIGDGGDVHVYSISQQITESNTQNTIYMPTQEGRKHS